MHQLSEMYERYGMSHSVHSRVQYASPGRRYPGGGKMKIGAKGIAASAIATILGGVVLLMALGSWQTESEKIPVKFSTGEFAGMANPGDIRGSYSFADVEKNFPVTADTLAAAFGLDVAVKPAQDYL